MRQCRLGVQQSAANGAVLTERNAQPTYGCRHPYDISILTTAEQVERIVERCALLLDAPLEPNVFYEPWMLAAALAARLTDNARIVVVSESASRQVTGIFPFELHERLRGLPIRVLRSWQHAYCYLCTPLLAGAHAPATLQCLFDWLECKQAPAHTVELNCYSANGAFDALLRMELKQRECWQSLLQCSERAMLYTREGQTLGISGKHLKELRRRARRLGELGPCRYRVFAAADNIDAWLTRFLELEASGWKGRAGTALASHRNSRHFFACIAKTAAEQDRLQMLALELNGAPIAMLCSFIAGEGAFGFKMAYDERYAKYSPGVLLQLFNTRHVAERYPQVRWIDSCTVPQHTLMNRLWTQRRTLGSCLASCRPVPAALIGGWPHVARLRSLLKGVRWPVTARNP